MLFNPSALNMLTLLGQISFTGSGGLKLYIGIYWQAGFLPRTQSLIMLHKIASRLWVCWFGFGVEQAACKAALLFVATQK